MSQIHIVWWLPPVVWIGGNVLFLAGLAAISMWEDRRTEAHFRQATKEN